MDTGFRSSLVAAPVSGHRLDLFPATAAGRTSYSSGSVVNSSG